MEVQATFPGEGESPVRRMVKDLLASGYDGGFSIEPHIHSIVSEGKTASDPDAAYNAYIEYGRRLMDMFKGLK